MTEFQKIELGGRNIQVWRKPKTDNDDKSHSYYETYLFSDGDSQPDISRKRLIDANNPELYMSYEEISNFLVGKTDFQNIGDL